MMYRIFFAFPILLFNINFNLYASAVGKITENSSLPSTLLRSPLKPLPMILLSSDTKDATLHPALTIGVSDSLRASKPSGKRKLIALTLPVSSEKERIGEPSSAIPGILSLPFIAPWSKSIPDMDEDFDLPTEDGPFYGCGVDAEMEGKMAAGSVQADMAWKAAIGNKQQIILSMPAVTTSTVLRSFSVLKEGVESGSAKDVETLAGSFVKRTSKIGRKLELVENPPPIDKRLSLEYLGTKENPCTWFVYLHSRYKQSGLVSIKQDIEGIDRKVYTIAVADLRDKTFNAFVHGLELLVNWETDMLIEVILDNVPKSAKEKLQEHPILKERLWTIMFHTEK